LAGKAVTIQAVSSEKQLWISDPEEMSSRYLDTLPAYMAAAIGSGKPEVAQGAYKAGKHFVALYDSNASEGAAILDWEIREFFEERKIEVPSYVPEVVLQ